MSLNKVMLIGRLGQDPEMKYTPSGAAVCNFSVATSETWVDKNGNKQEKTEWHRIVVWGKLAEICNQYLQKGKQAYIEGSLETRSWEGKDGKKNYMTEVKASTVQFLGGPTRSNDNQQRQENSQKSQDNNLPNDYEISTDASFTSDDIPF